MCLGDGLGRVRRMILRGFKAVILGDRPGRIDDKRGLAFPRAWPSGGQIEFVKNSLAGAKQITVSGCDVVSVRNRLRDWPCFRRRSPSPDTQKEKWESSAGVGGTAEIRLSAEEALSTLLAER